MARVKFAWAMSAGLILAGCQTIGDSVRIDNVPMYGQPEVERPARLKQADRAFVAAAMAGVREQNAQATRRDASEVWWLTGEDFLHQGNLDYAMRRYNQAWLLDPTNYQPFWGFGRVMLEWDQLDRAVANFEQALTLLDNPEHKTALSVDAATAYSWRGSERNRKGTPSAVQDFARANALFASSATESPANANIYRRWAMSLFREQKYADAWTKVAETRRRNGPPFPPEFLDALAANAPEPR